MSEKRTKKKMKKKGRNYYTFSFRVSRTLSRSYPQTLGARFSLLPETGVRSSARSFFFSGIATLSGGK